MKRLIKAVDLFCGAGGTTSGLRRACQKRRYKLQLTAVNHWDIAIATHSANHPDAAHVCASIDAVDPLQYVPDGYLDLLIAAPECRHHSIARGGRPVNDQSRASAWLILRWLELLYVKALLLENVKEFRDWGPIGANGRPLKSKRGETFRAFVAALRSLGYRVEWKILNAADYGDPTTRERLFLIAKRGNHKIRWPEPTHTASDNGRLFGKRQKWRAAREIIDWSLPGASIFTRKRPLAPKTLERIFAGLERFGGKDLQPFLVILRNNSTAQSVEEPVPTLTAGGKHVGVAQPFILPHRMFDGMQVDSVDRPLRTIRAHGNNVTLVEPFIVPNNENNVPKSTDEPVPTITTGNRLFLAEPFIVGTGGPSRSGDKVRSVNEPLHTVLTRNHKALVEPCLVTVNHGNGKEGTNGNSRRSRSIDDPLPTLACSNSLGLAEPFLLQLTHGGRVYDAKEPMPTITTARRGETAIVSPLIAKYNGTGGCQTVEEPLDTISTRDRFGLVMPVVDGYALDIRFRMLQPKELAAAMGFHEDYQFQGNREDIVKQIGNAVAVNVAQALCEAVLG